MSCLSQTSYRTRIWTLLTRAERGRFVALVFLMILAMGLETLGIGLVIPLLAALTQSGETVRIPLLGFLFQLLGSPSSESRVLAVTLVLVGLYTVKACYLAFVASQQITFAFGIQQQLSHRLFSLYLRQPYSFLLGRNSAQLIQNITREINLFTTYTIIPCLNLLAETLVLIGLAALLLAVEPIGALVVGFMLVVLSSGFHYLIRIRVIRWGEARQFHEKLRLQRLQEGLGAAKDVKLLGRELDFLEQFRDHNEKSARMARMEQTLAALPRLGLELLAVAAILALALILLARGESRMSLLPTIGVFAAAAFRVLPSATRVFGAIQSLKFSKPVVDILHAEFSLSGSVNEYQCTSPRLFRSALHLLDVSYSYPGRPEPAVKRISMMIHRGEAVGIIGPSGAGKSTLIDILLGLLKPDSGDVQVDGHSIHESLRDWQNQLGYVPQTIFLTDDSVRRNVAFGVQNERIDERAMENAIRAARLEDFVKSLPQGLDTLVGERGVRLSAGQRQRIGLARALYHEPAVLVLDEATSALDLTTEQEVMEAVKSITGQRTIVVVSHRLSTMQHCQRLYRLENGQVVAQGTLGDLLQGQQSDSSRSD